MIKYQNDSFSTNLNNKYYALSYGLLLSNRLLYMYNIHIYVPGSPLLCCAAAGHVDGDEQLHVLRPLPGEVLHGEEQHVGVGAGGGGDVVAGPPLRGQGVLPEQLHGGGPLRVQDVPFAVPKHWNIFAIYVDNLGHICVNLCIFAHNDNFFYQSMNQIYEYRRYI